MPTVVAPITSEGAIVEILLSVSEFRARALVANSQSIPSPIRLRMLVDTGASHSCVVAGLLAPLGLSPTGSVAVHIASSSGTPVNHDLYDVGLIGPDAQPTPWAFPICPISECLPLHGTIQGLLGRDIIDQTVMVYNPRGGGFLTISF